ncbi:unnamed protein product [Urochloa humidicola]
MEKDLRSRLRRWHKTSVVLNAVRRFSRVPLAKVHDDDDPQDLEKNITPVRQRLAWRFLLVHPIKCIISWLVRATVCCLEIIQKLDVDQTPDQLQQKQKRCSKYSQKALMFAITMFVAYLGSSSASPSTGSTAFKVATAAFFVAILIDLISITRSPKWGYTLVYLSWILLVLLSYLLLVSFHKDYRWAIIPVPLLFFAALLQCKLRPNVRQQSTTNSAEPSEHPNSTNEADRDLGTDNKADQGLEDIFDTAAAIVNSGGFISMILGHYMYMVGPDHLSGVSFIGFPFFFTVVLGLYLMMVATVRSAALTCWASYLYYLLGFLLVGTLIATVIHLFWLSSNGSHV